MAQLFINGKWQDAPELPHTPQLTPQLTPQPEIPGRSQLVSIPTRNPVSHTVTLQETVETSEDVG